MPMKNPPHPDLSVRHDCLEPLGLSITEAAQKLGSGPQTAIGHSQRPFWDIA